MSDLIQSLESRVLFSIPAGLAAGAQLATDVGTARADVTQYAATLKQDVQTITADLKALPPSAQNTSLLAALRNDRAKWTTVLQQDVAATVRAATANGTRTVQDAIQLFLHQTSTVYANRLAHDLSVINGAVASPLAKLESDIGSGRTALLNDLNAIASANPSTGLQTDVNSIAGDTQTAIDKLTADAQSIQTDLQSIATALTA